MSFKQAPYSKRLLAPYPGIRELLGPGIILMAVAQGSGELIWWPYLVAKYGVGFVWLLIPAVLVQYPLMFEIARYSAFASESIWLGFMRLNRSFTFLLWIVMVISFAWIGAWASAGGTALFELTGWPEGLKPREGAIFWAVLTVIFSTFCLLTKKRTYHFIEGLMWFVAVVTVIGLAISSLHPQVRAFAPEFARGLVQPSLKLERVWDPNDLEKVLSGIITAGMGGFWCLFYSYWVLGKGFAGSGAVDCCGSVPDTKTEHLLAHGRRWRRFFVFDSGVGVIGNLATTLMICLLSYALLHPTGAIPEGWKITLEQSRFFEVSWGSWGRRLFLLVAACFLADTWPTAVDATAKVNIEILSRIFPGLKRVSERRFYCLMVLAFAIVSLVTICFEQPGPMLVLSAMINCLAMPVLIWSVMILVHGQFKNALPASLRPGRLSLLLLAVTGATYTLLTAFYLYVRIGS